MDLNWIKDPFAIYGVLAFGGVSCLYLVISTKMELRRQQVHHRAESSSMQEAMSALQGKLTELSCEVTEKAAVPSPAINGINIRKRAEALRMLRRDCDTHTIAAALGMTLPEIELIRKVHSMAAARAESAAAPPNHSSGGTTFQDFSKRAMYSAEA